MSGDDAAWAAAAAQQARSSNPKSVRMNDVRLHNVQDSKRWSFQYDVDAQTDHAWGAPLTCMRCVHVNESTGKRCKRETCLTLPVCWQHLKSDYKLRVGRTTLRDTQGTRLNFLGLFACDTAQPRSSVVFERGDYIVPYIGELVDAETLEARYPDTEVAPYVERVGRNRFIDAGPMRGVASISNMCAPWLAFKPDGVTPMCTNNVIIESRGVGSNSFPFLKAARSIKNGDEIFANYGPAYFAHDTIHLRHETRPVKAYTKTEYKCTR